MIETNLEFPKSGTAELFALRLLDFDAARIAVRVQFDASPALTNPAGAVQGGMLAAMLDDTIGPSVWLGTQGEFYPVTIDLNVQFLAPAAPGRFIGEGRLVQHGKTIGFAEARLMTEAGTIVARATASLRLVKADRAV
jgi:uncharacterized protein (TIGR00369 family)